MENNYNAKNKDTYEISLDRIFGVFKRNFIKMLLVGVIFGLISFTYFNFFVPKSYTTRVKLYVETSGLANNNAYTAMSNYNYAAALVNTYIQMLSTNNFYSKLSENIDGKYSSGELSRIVTFKSEDNDNQTEVFSAIITGKSPMEAKVIADSVADTAPGVISSLKNDDTELKIVDNATIPSQPSSPQVFKNTVFAFAAGFILMLIYAFVKDALDNKIKFSSELTEINNVPILSAVPDFGAKKFILNINLDSDASESEG